MTETEAKQLINNAYPDTVDGTSRPGASLDVSMPFNTTFPQVFEMDYAGPAIFNVAHQQAFSNDKFLNEKIDAMVAAGLSHNGIYRGKDLTSYFDSGEMSTAIASGKFTDIYIGDYITKKITIDDTTYTVKWEVADLDYYYQVGDTACTAHHVVLFPSTTVQVNVKMNDTNDTTGAYVGSKMWTEQMPKYQEAIIAAFGDSHVLKHREILSNAMTATVDSMAGAGWVGASTNWAWTDVYVNIPNEPMIYGCTAFSSSAFDVGEANKQFALMRFDRFNKGRKWFWLRAVASGARFCGATDGGHADYRDASGSGSYGGIRPYFLLR